MRAQAHALGLGGPEGFAFFFPEMRELVHGCAFGVGAYVSTCREQRTKREKKAARSTRDAAQHKLLCILRLL